MKKILLAILAAFMCIGMAACTPSSVEKAEEKMQEAGYKVVAYSNKDAEGMVGGFVATKGLTDLTNSMTAALFDSKDAASDFYSSLSETGAVLDGKWVYWGAEEAIDEFTAMF